MGMAAGPSAASCCAANLVVRLKSVRGRNDREKKNIVKEDGGARSMRRCEPLLDS